MTHHAKGTRIRPDRHHQQGREHRLMECKNHDKNVQRCTCPSENCERKGYCCECVAAHIEGGSLPSCLKALVAEDS